jgi:thiol-disulfide isomerase/thioredoxin
MDNNTIVTVVILVLLFIPNSSGLSLAETGIPSLDKYSKLENEGFVGFQAAAIDDSKQEEAVDNTIHETKDCECKGTGTIRTGDNRLLPCPCANCSCKKITDNNNTININLGTEEDSQKKNTELSTVPKEQDSLIEYSIDNLDMVIIVFTNPEWCAPCKRLENTTFQELKKVGYKFGSLAEADTCHIILLNEEHPLYAKYGVGTIPTFIFINDGKIFTKITGYQTSQMVSKLYNSMKE